MSRNGINERILEGIRKTSEDDQILNDFLIELIYKEVEHPGWWRELYRKLIEKYSDEWGDENED